jgi:subtilisin family serine protease
MKTQLLQFICKALLLCLILTLSGNLLAQDLFSYQNGKKQFYKIASDKFFIRFKKDVSNNVKKQVIGNMKALGDNNHPNGFTFISFSAKKQDEMLSLAKSYMQNDNVLAASPILLNENDKKIGALTEQFIVKLKANTTIKQLQNLAFETSTEIIKQYDMQTYILSVDRKSQGNALEMANLFYERGFFEWSEPNYLIFIQFTSIPNDPLFNQQWSLKNVTQNGGIAGADIKASQAWDITTGSSNIKVAIVDTGIDLEHEDLQTNIYSGYDATGNESGGRPTSDNLDVTAIPTEDNKDLTIASSIDFEAKLIDQDGKVAREGKNLNKEKKITLDVKGLKAGTYFLHIVSGKQVEKHQIVVGK